MTILVNHCYHWLSFHLINELIDNSYTVVGMNDYENKLTDHLSMFLGRNSLFTEETSYSNFHYESAIIFGDIQDRKIKSDRVLRLYSTADSQFSSDEDNVTRIHLPLLFGNWMPMTKKGMYNDSKFVSFQSIYFKEQAIYIGDFCKLLISLLQQSQLPREVKVFSANSQNNKEKILENSVYIHDNIPIQEKLKKVINHYTKYSHFYLY